jgi:hypothetical protein
MRMTAAFDACPTLQRNAFNPSVAPLWLSRSSAMIPFGTAFSTATVTQDIDHFQLALDAVEPINH